MQIYLENAKMAIVDKVTGHVMKQRWKNSLQKTKLGWNTSLSIKLTRIPSCSIRKVKLIDVFEILSGLFTYFSDKIGCKAGNYID